MRLVNRVFDTPESLRDGVRAIAADIAGKAPLAVRGVKEMIGYARELACPVPARGPFLLWGSGTGTLNCLSAAMVAINASRPLRMASSTVSPSDMQPQKSVYSIR